MTLQDGLLSFQIKETIFLSSDKAGIGELKELELVPDVEIIENQKEVSITGCLQLHGKYEPVRGTAEESDGGADTLIAAMKFTPYQVDRREGGLFGSDEELAHRIPLNITIPSNRVKDIQEIYAIVDSFDYQLASPNRLVIEAELKIAGIAPADDAKQTEPEWEFVHVAQDQQDAENPSLDDIERKLSQLEQQIARKENEQQESAADLPEPYVKPYVVGYEQPSHEQPSQKQPATWKPSHFPPTYQPPAHLAETLQSQSYQPASYQPDAAESRQRFGDVSSEQEEAQHQTVSYRADETWESRNVTDDVQEESFAERETAGQVEQTEEPSAAESEEPAEQEVVSAVNEPEESSLEEETPAAVDAQQADESENAVETEKEMRVAIGSKQTQEERGSLNLTSIFAKATRTQEQPSAEVEESNSGSKESSGAKQTNSGTGEAMNNLASFVRNKEERYSTMKLCIIQRDETLESIAARYSLPVSKILEVNNLSSDQVSEGQILYIPV